MSWKGLGLILAVIFMVLKLTGHISWSWVWGAAPLWIPLGAAATFILLAAVLAVGSMIFSMVNHYNKHPRF